MNLVKFFVIFIALVMISSVASTTSTFAQTNPNPSIIVEVDDFEYEIGETVNVRASIQNTSGDQDVVFRVIDPAEKTVLTKNLQAGGGLLFFDFSLDKCSFPGHYKIIGTITVNGQTYMESESFVVTGELDPNCEYDAEIKDVPTTPEPPSQSTDSISIPDWVRNNAEWWAEGQIDDDTFVSGIQFMIKEEIIKVPPTEKKEGSETVIPDWVRNNAGWWAEGQIGDSDFANGLQFLIANGIITV